MQNTAIIINILIIMVKYSLEGTTETLVSNLVDSSFLSPDLKAKYKNSFLERKYSYVIYLFF